MTDVRVPAGPQPGLQSGTGPAPDAARAADGLEARPALVSLLPSGGAPVCEGDACFFEVPD
jgi:hypothetical protein